MKKFGLFLSVLAVFVLFFSFQVLILNSVLALDLNVDREGYVSEEIENFDVKINIQNDGSFLVEEKIVYNFGSAYKHGIYRVIPLKGIKVSGVKVVDESNKPYKFSVEKESNLIKIKIGDPNVIIHGVHIYNISYKVERGILFFKDFDKIYWNVTGNEWQVPIEKVKLTIFLPEEISPGKLKPECFVGVYGSRDKNCQYMIIGKDIVEVTATKKLGRKEGLTAVLAFPKGIVKGPSFIQRILWAVKKYWPLAIPPLVFVFLFYQWLTKGKDPKIKKPIVPFYESPNNLRPAEIEAILKQKLSNKAVSATFIDLAVRGFLKIKKIKKKNFISRDDYELILVKDFKKAKGLLDYEKDFLRQLFGDNLKITTLSLIKKESALAGLINNVSESFDKLTKEGYFVKNPENVSSSWQAIGWILTFLFFLSFPIIRDTSIEFSIYFMLFITPFLMLISAKIKKSRNSSGILFLLEKIVEKFHNKISWSSILVLVGSIIVAISFFFFLHYFFIFAQSWYLTISLLISGILFIIFSPFMPKRTKKGAEIYWKILGFRDFIRTAEKYRAQFYERENIFEKYLPYAILFGLTDKWAKSFEGIYKSSPLWYEDITAGSVGAFSVLAFSRSIDHSLSQLSSGGFTGVESGGGFSGGGFGGGGGGSW